MCSDNYLPTFRENLSIPSSRVKNPKRSPPRNFAEERRSYPATRWQFLGAFEMEVSVRGFITSPHLTPGQPKNGLGGFDTLGFI